jgi:chemotaxis protein methyltransferase CheR
VAVFGEKKTAPLFTATRTQNDSPAIVRPNPILPTQAKSDYKINPEEFIQLRDFLYEQAGIFIAENRKYLMENRLSSRLRELGLRNFHEYHNYLRFDNNRMAELNKLFENMTTNETSFFRNNPQIDIFKDKVLTRIVDEQRAKGQKKIHIWSAGCSSGEEPYTIGIVLHELLKNEIDSWDIKITANDLSLAMLTTAQKGLYSDYALRTTPQAMIDKYFTKEGKMFKILPKVQKLVRFGQINLASTADLSKVERSHIVFCRNVIIYFDDDMKRHVINAFYDNLLPGGFLLIGHSESLHSISRTFIPEHYTGAIVYGKKS